MILDTGYVRDVRCECGDFAVGRVQGQDLCEKCLEQVEWPDIDLVTPEEWRNFSDFERELFRRYWARKGIVYFCCMICYYPTAFGQVGCESCSKHLRKEHI
ncbi:MAG: hypothetical protein WC455_11190 [Dehalococcoidia bacterium]|jgi:hypothetical protein